MESSEATQVTNVSPLLDLGVAAKAQAGGRRLRSAPSLRLLQLLKSIQVLNGQFHRSATRERPPDIAGHAAGEPLASIVDLNERLFAYMAGASHDSRL